MGNQSSSKRRRLGSVLLVMGLVILLTAAAYVGWTQVQAARVRAALAQVPPAAAARPAETPPAATAAPAAQPTQPPLTATPTTEPPTAAPPSPTATAAVETPAAPATETPAPPATETPAPPPSPTPQPPAPAVVATQAAAPVRLVFGDLNIDARVVPMGWEVVQTAAGPRSEWVIPKDDAGHHINSALLGQNDNLVISGHNNIFGMVFKPISLAWDNDARAPVDSYTDRSDLLNGRIITLYDAAGQAFTYEVNGFLRLKDTGVPLEQRIANARFMQPTGEAQLTIITCWPPSNNTHRLIVLAKPVS